MIEIMENTLIKRAAYGKIRRFLQPEKVVVLCGPRRVGKTTLLNQVKEEYKDAEKILFVTGEDVTTHEPLSSRRLDALKNFVGQATLLIIDKAQLIPDIGTNLKILVDTQPKLKIIASGSSSFDLARKIGEPLVGRKWTVRIFPLAVSELVDFTNWFAVTDSLETLLVYGSYPEVMKAGGLGNKKEILWELVDSYLYKDVMSVENLRKPKIIRNLLELLAYRIGQEVSLTELGNALQTDRETVARYLYVLEEAFVIVNIRGYSRNLRKEITKSSRYYFYDNGVRNALIGNFNSWQKRNDIGSLWKNWLVMERLKKQAYTPLYADNYFWRTYDQKEIDWLEEREGKLFGYEFSWQPKSVKKSTQREFLRAYPESELSVVHRENYEEFVV